MNIRSILLALTAAEALAVPAQGAYPYGICSHIANDEFDGLERSLKMMAVAGVQSVRTDFTWSACDAGDTLDFTRFDAVMDAADRQGVKIAPVLGVPPERYGGGKYSEACLDAWATYCGAVAARYKGRVPDYEIVNEADGQGNLADPAVYAKFLKRAAAAIRAADPAAKVSTTGMIKIPLDWVRGLYQAGAKDDFDILAIHPYTHPDPPESTYAGIAQLRAVMAEFGDGDKPVRINEVGWPTHRMGLGTHTTAFLDLAVRKYFSGKGGIRAAYADMATEYAEPNDAVAEEILRQLPAGSTSRALSPTRLANALAANEIDLVVLLGEDYSPRILEPLAAFLAKGGIAVHGNAWPLAYARERSATGAMVTYDRDVEQDRRSLRLRMSAWWVDEKYAEAKSGKLAGMMTDEAKALGFKGDLGKYTARLFVEDTYLKAGDRFIRIVGGTTGAGATFTQGAICEFDSDWKGAFVVSALDEGCWLAVAGDAEKHQAMCVARGMGLAMAMGIDAYYPYEFRAGEDNVYYSEANFGLVHNNFSPKPGWSAYTTFVSARPAGSANLTDRKWRNDAGTAYCPCWKRPDGSVAGMVWRTDKSQTISLRFTGGAPILFLDMLGARLNPLETESGVYTVEVGPYPVYFIGGVPAQ